MKNNLARNHLTFSAEELELLSNNDSINAWLSNIKVSDRSYFSDDVWILDGSESHKKQYLQINWADLLPNSETKYLDLTSTVKKCIFYSQTTLCSQSPKKPLSQTNITIYFKVLIKWMYDNNIEKFQDITPEKFKLYNQWVNNKKNHLGKNIKDRSAYFIPLTMLYIYKDFLEDSINFDILSGSSLYKFSEIDKEKRVQTQAIPTHILEELMQKIIPIINYLDGKKNLNLIEIFEAKILPINHFITFCNVLNAIGYSVIGLYTGMRASEILSIKKDSVKISDNTILINSLLFKTTFNKKGRLETWACGLNNDNNYALKTIKILERLTPDSHSNLFFKYYNQKYSTLNTSSINDHLQKMLDIFNINWDISTHQFRRTFAKLIGTTDRTNLLALQQHFKHVSISMTSYYVGNEADLLEMIGEEKQMEIAAGLESILSSDKLGGKLGEKISKSNLRFRGQAGKQLRQDYIETLLHDSDLIIMPHEYGFCIYQPEQARCQGDQKNIGLNTCVKCSNFVVSSEHKVFWSNRVNEYEKFAAEIQDLPNQETTVKELKYNINEAKQIINKIEGENNETTL